MKTAEEILQPYIETPFRHMQVVEKYNALIAIWKIQILPLNNGMI